jgi:hypothetical protein
MKLGRVIGEMHRRHRSAELLQFLNTIDAQPPTHLDIHRFTPPSASRLNLVERWFSKRPREYLVISNQSAKPFVWTKTADEILEEVAGFCQRISNSGH